jgi:hypothetical protein
LHLVIVSERRREIRYNELGKKRMSAGGFEPPTNGLKVFSYKSFCRGEILEASIFTHKKVVIASIVSKVSMLVAPILHPKSR